MRHLEAVEKAVADAALISPRYAPLVELCRTLAAQMDEAGSGASTRLTAAYLSALKDLNRATAQAKPATGGTRVGQLRSAYKGQVS